MFDAKQYLEGYERPVFVDREGKRHEGEIVSAKQMLGVYEDINRFATGDGFKLPEQWDELVAFVTELCKLAFPGNEEVAGKLLELPTGAFRDAMVDLLGCMTGRTKVSAPASAVPPAAPPA